MNHILLVDDDLHFRRSLIIHMELEGYQVTGAESPSRALSILKKYRSEDILPDVVISDIKMPGMDGKNFANEIKKIYPELPIILISAFDVAENVLEYPFLKKPFKVKEILNIVNNLIK